MEEEQQHHLVGHLDHRSVETELAQELNQMSFVSRNEMNEEIHGLRTLLPEESQAMIASKLAELDREMSMLPNKPSYDRATKLSSQYVNSTEFKLRFLRAEVFDAKLAAVRLEKFLSFTEDHFGEVALKRPIFLDDLDKEEMDILKAGNFQLLPCRDRSGRRIAVRLGAIGAGSSSFRRTRALLYMVQVLSEDLETQRKGCVVILAPGGKESHQNESLFPNFNEKMAMVHGLCDCMPLRISAYHVCSADSPLLHAFLSLTLVIVPKHIRARFRVHKGSPLEWQYTLSSFGINAEFLPFTTGGELKVKNHFKWMKLRKAKEEAVRIGVPFHGIECPFVHDIFFRRGTNPHGNMLLREVLELKYEQYRSRSTQDEKTEISWWVVEEVERRKGRFLIEGPQGFWVELTNKDLAREKIANAFRDLRKVTASKGRRSSFDGSAKRLKLEKCSNPK